MYHLVQFAHKVLRLLVTGSSISEMRLAFSGEANHAKTKNYIHCHLETSLPWLGCHPVTPHKSYQLTSSAFSGFSRIHPLVPHS